MLKRALLLLVLPLTLLTAGCEATVDEEESADDSISSSAAAITSSTAGEKLYTTANVRLREEGSTASRILRVLPTGTAVTSKGQMSGAFVSVTAGTQEGWVHGSYLSKEAGGQGQPASAGNGGQAISGQTMLWQGNWAFLVKCDSYSRAKGKVVYSCDETVSRAFVDDGYWIAVPASRFKRSLCGGTARVCKGGTCVNATIVERSVTGSKWEGSTAVLRALGVSAGWTGSCSSSYGTATGVTITL